MLKKEELHACHWLRDKASNYDILLQEELWKSFES